MQKTAIFRLLRTIAVALPLLVSLGLGAQNHTRTITGTVTEAATGEPVIGAGVMLKASNIGTITDLNGHYSITVNDQKGILVVSSIGFKSIEVLISGKSEINFKLENDSESLQDAVVIGYGAQKKATVTGALTVADTKIISTSSQPSLSNALGGVMPGVITRQSNGEPGYDGATILIRGLGTWGNASPLVLVDGVERDINLINNEEIASFSVLKDASATAVYGMRGANGVILINTKKGTVGRPKVTFRTEHTCLTGLRFPQYVEAYEFANLMNEACETGGVAIPWSDEEIEKFRDGSDPYNYPNNNWTDLVLKKNSYQTMNNLSVSGGNETVRYYTSIGFTSQSGLFKEDPSYSYRTNSLSQRYNFRANVDVNITKDLSLYLGLGEIVENRTYPGTSSWQIFHSLKYCSPLSFPIKNPDGSFGGGNSSYEWTSPYVWVTNSGFSKQFRSTTQGTGGLKWDLGRLVTEGLQIEANFAYDHWYFNEVTRNKTVEVKKYLGTDTITGEDKYNIISEEQPMGYRVAFNSSNRAIYWDARINYNRNFGKHGVGAMLMFNQRDYQDLTVGDSKANLNYRRQGFSGRFNYNYDETYLVEFNFGYNGSENFAPGHRYGFFPAVSAGWVPTNNDFWNIDWINHLKIRGSFGIVGNDANGASRFFYMSSVNTSEGFPYGEAQTWIGGLTEGQLGSPNATWEKSHKTDVGLDIEMFDRKLKISADYFYEYRDQILLQRRTIPQVMGLQGATTPWANIGIMKNQGMDGQIEFTNTTSGGFFYSIRGNITFARNKVIDDDSARALYDYQNSRGFPAGRSLGYIALGLFQSQEEIDESPVQELGSYGVGDIKYKDVNEDGVINAYDRVWLGYGRNPEIMYGIGATFAYKGFDLTLNFTGAGHTSIFIVEASMWPFSLDYPGYNILREYYDNRFVPGRDNQNAKYPVVHNGRSANNFTVNSLYQRNGSYLKLKTAELGYNFPTKMLEKAKISQLRLFLNGNNLFCIDGVKIVDPESDNYENSGYPSQRALTFGVQIGF